MSHQLQDSMKRLSDEIDEISKSQISDDPAMRRIVSLLYSVRHIISELIVYLNNTHESTQSTLQSLEETQEKILARLGGPAKWWSKVWQTVAATVIVSIINLAGVYFIIGINV